MVKDSRPDETFGFVTHRRRRECQKCGHRYSTLEVHADLLEVADIKGLMQELNSPD